MGFVKNINDVFRRIVDGQDKKKIIENSIIVIIIGIIFLLAGSTILKKNENTLLNSNKQSNYNEEPQLSADEKKDDTILASKSGGAYSVEKEMEEILSQIQGVGKVSVMITYESGSEKVPAYDKRENRSTTQEEDNNGGKRTITQNELEDNVVYEEQQGGIKKPVILKEIEPKIKGVVVVADGAGEPIVKESLVKAVQALVDVAVHKVQVFKRADK